MVSTAEAYTLLLEIWRSREPVTIRTSTGAHTNMVLVSLTADGVATFRPVAVLASSKGGR